MGGPKSRTFEIFGENNMAWSWMLNPLNSLLKRRTKICIDIDWINSFAKPMLIPHAWIKVSLNTLKTHGLKCVQTTFKYVRIDDRFAIIDDHVYFPGDFFCTSSSSPMGERRWPKPSRLYVAEDCAGLAPLVECCKNLGLDFKVWGLQPKNKTTLTNNLCCEDGWIESRALLHVRVRRSPAKAFEGLVQSGDDVEGLFEAQRHLVLETSQDDYTRHKIPMWHNYSIVIITIIVPFNSKIILWIE